MAFLQSIIANFYRYLGRYTASLNGRTSEIANDVTVPMTLYGNTPLVTALRAHFHLAVQLSMAKKPIFTFSFLHLK